MIDPRTTIGAVHLTTTDVNRSVQFYESRLGFRLHRSTDEAAVLGAGADDLLVLHGAERALRVTGTTGLYHFAILVPSRADLARSLRRLVATDTILQGAADHGVSEALYLSDPDGNGIEIYRDRPRDEWPVVNGALRMGADPLDFNGIFAEPGGESGAAQPLAIGTTIGHVHLHVSDLAAAERFYVGVLGFELRQRYGPSAIFVAAGGYHHHVGLNTWAGTGAPPPPAGAVGLRHFVVRLSERAAVDAVVARLDAAATLYERRDGDVLTHDPSSNALLLTSGQDLGRQNREGSN